MNKYRPLNHLIHQEITYLHNFNKDLLNKNGEIALLVNQKRLKRLRKLKRNLTLMILEIMMKIK